MISILMVLGSLLALGLGPVLYHTAGGRARWEAVLDVAVVLSVGVVAMVQIIPETFETVGAVAAVPLVLGLLLPTILERWQSHLEKHAHGIVLWLVALGLASHAAVDGIALTLEPGEGGWHTLPALVILHRIPTSLVVWRLLHGHEGDRRAWWGLGLIGVSTVVGFGAGEAWMAGLHSTTVGLFQAFVAGSLLHVVVHTFHLGGHDHSHSGSGHHEEGE